MTMIDKHRNNGDMRLPQDDVKLDKPFQDDDGIDNVRFKVDKLSVLNQPQGGPPSMREGITQGDGKNPQSGLLQEWENTTVTDAHMYLLLLKKAQQITLGKVPKGATEKEIKRVIEAFQNALHTLSVEVASHYRNQSEELEGKADKHRVSRMLMIWVAFPVIAIIFGALVESLLPSRFLMLTNDGWAVISVMIVVFTALAAKKPFLRPGDSLYEEVHDEKADIENMSPSQQALLKEGKETFNRRVIALPTTQFSPAVISDALTVRGVGLTSAAFLVTSIPVIAYLLRNDPVSAIFKGSLVAGLTLAVEICLMILMYLAYWKGIQAEKILMPMAREFRDAEETIQRTLWDKYKTTEDQKQEAEELERKAKRRVWGAYGGAAAYIAFCGLASGFVIYQDTRVALYGGFGIVVALGAFIAEFYLTRFMLTRLQRTHAMQIFLKDGHTTNDLEAREACKKEMLGSSKRDKRLLIGVLVGWVFEMGTLVVARTLMGRSSDSLIDGVNVLGILIMLGGLLFAFIVAATKHQADKHFLFQKHGVGNPEEMEEKI